MKKIILLLLLCSLFILCSCDYESYDIDNIDDMDDTEPPYDTEIYLETEAEHSHSLVFSEKIEPTCTMDGMTVGMRCDCGYSVDGDVIAALGHDMVKMPEKPATINENGHTAYLKCSRCGFEEGKKATTFVCTHKYVSYSAKAATPSAKGHTAYSKCSVCGDIQGYKEVEYVYPCIEMLPSVYDRISVFSLSEADKKEIVGMYNTVMSFGGNYAFQSNVSKFKMDQYFKIIVYSLPETFMMTSTYTYYHKGDTMTSINFKYDMTRDKYISMMTEVEKKVKTLNSAVKGKSEFEKVVYFSNYLIENCTYTLEGKNVTSVYGALISGKNHCDGFADAMNLLCNVSGVKCQTVLGYMGETYHAWNIINIGGKYYYFDTTANNVDWYDKPLYAVFGASRSYMEAISYTLEQYYTSIVPEAKADFSISNRYMPTIGAKQNVDSAMKSIANNIVKNKPNHIYIRCEGQSIYDSATTYINYLNNTIKKAYPNAQLQFMNKKTLKIVCIVINY